MENEGLASDNDDIEDQLFNGEDEVIISRFLKRMILNGDSWPQHFKKDVDVFNKNPNEKFDSENPTYVIVKPRTGACGKTDGCESGCWRIMARDKLIKSKEPEKILGFKKIFKFCLKRKPREYKRSWVMEEYRLTNKLNWKQDHVICKIRLLFEAEFSSLLVKHFRTTSESLLANEMLPAFGFSTSSNPQDEDEAYLVGIMVSGGNNWPSYVTNKMYRLNPLMLVDPLDQMFRRYGTCIFANITYSTTDKCDGGYWRIMQPDTPIKSSSGKILGFKKVFKFYETEKQSFVHKEGEDVKITWIIEEYRINEEDRFNEEEKQNNLNKVLCVIKFTKDN